MGNMLAAFGRSGSLEKAFGIAQNVNAYRQGESRIALNEEQLAQTKRENQLADAEEARLNKKIDLEGIYQAYPGGKDGAIAQGVDSFFRSRSLVDMEFGAIGQVTQRALDEHKEWVATNPIELSQSVVKHLQNEYKKRDDINAQLKEKPGDPKLLEALQNVNLSVQQATEWVAGIKTETTRRAKIKEAEVLAAEKAKAAEKERLAEVEPDRIKAEGEAKQKRLDRESKERIAGVKPPTLKRMVSKKTGKLTWHQWTDGKWIDTGRETKLEGSGTGEERKRATLIAKLPEFQRMAKEDPNKLYKEKSIQMNDDGTIPTDAFGAPIVLPPPHKVLGKRTSVKAVMALGEHYHDAVQLQELLDDPEVARDLKAAADAGYWDRTKGSVSNKIRKWMRSSGIHPDSKTATAIGRMEKMGSELRKKYLGSAVTVPELKTFKPWAPSAGDSYEQMLNKNRLLISEGKEEFYRFLDYYKNQANMSSLYEAFGIKRFSTGQSNQVITKIEYDALINQGFTDEQINEKYEVQ